LLPRKDSEETTKKECSQLKKAEERPRDCGTRKSTREVGLMRERMNEEKRMHKAKVRFCKHWL